MSLHTEIQWFRVRREADLERIPSFLKEHRVNTFTYPRPDKNGKPYMMFGYDARPDSDYGRFKGNSAAVWFESAELAEAGVKIASKALGFADDAAEPAR